MKLKTIYKLLLITLLLAAALILPRYWTSGFSRIIRLLIIIVFVVQASILFKKQVIDSKRKEWIKNLAMAFFSFMVVLLFLECIFMLVPRSHSADYSLAAKIWNEKYWSPVNTYGFRDGEPVQKGNKPVFFIGDSFTAGYGLKNISSRYSDIVKEKLAQGSSHANVINLGMNGADTRKEYESLIHFIKTSGIHPQCIVLQYCGNDIEAVAMRNNMNYDYSPYKRLNRVSRALVKGSYLLNYFYWLFANNEKDIAQWQGLLKNAYLTDSVFAQHRQDIELFTTFAKQNNVKLVVVIFPFLQDLEFSSTVFTDKVKSLLDKNNVPSIDVSSLVKNINIEERVVSSVDGHASVYVNKLVGNAVYKEISEIRGLKN